MAFSWLMMKVSWAATYKPPLDPELWREMCFVLPHSSAKPQSSPAWSRKIPLCFKLLPLARLSMLQLLETWVFNHRFSHSTISVSVQSIPHLEKVVNHTGTVSCLFQQAVTDIQWVDSLQRKEWETVLFPAIAWTHCHHSWVLQTWLSSQRSQRCCRLSSAAHTRWPPAGRTGCSSWWGRCAEQWSTWVSLQADIPVWRRWLGSHRYSSHSGWVWHGWRWC